MTDNILKLAQALHDELVKELTEAKKATAEANQSAAAARIIKNSLDAKGIELAEREKALKLCEDPVHAAENARQIKADNNAEAAKIESEKQDLAKQKKDFASEMIAGRNKLAEAQAETAAAKENFKKQEAICKEKEAKLDEIKKQIKGL